MEQLNTFVNSRNDEDLPSFLSNPPAASNEPIGEICPFFSKTGMCRFGNVCSRHHEHPSISNTIVIPNFYNHFGLGKALRDEFNSDTSLEYEDKEIYQHFCEFQKDVLAELQMFGKMVQLKVCSNYQAHLRGNVYVQYTTQKEAVRAYLKLQGRWYDGRQLACHFVSIPSWRSAICGLFQQKKCPKGRNCNFLHVFRDPNGLFPDSTPHRADASVARSRQWRWSESPPPQSNKADDKADDKAKRRRLHNSPSQSKSKSSSKRIERRSKPRQGT